MSGPARENVPSSDEVTNFCLAAKRGDITYVRQMLESYGSDIVNKQDNARMSALSWAAYSGETEIMGLLLDNGAAIDAGTYYRGCTALAWAAYRGEEEAVLFLLKRGADASKKNSEGMTPADIARQYKYAAIATFIENWVIRQEAEKQKRAAQREKELTEVHFEMLKEKRPSAPFLIKKPFPKP